MYMFLYYVFARASCMLTIANIMRKRHGHGAIVCVVSFVTLMYAFICTISSSQRLVRHATGGGALEAQCSREVEDSIIVADCG